MATAFTDWEGTCLVHHGIKGQKWGVRRFQNPDGTLTELGRKRFAIDKGGNGKLESSFTRQNKKLSRLERKADIARQKAIAEKYSRRAKNSAKIAAGLGVAAAGSYLKDLKGHKIAAGNASANFKASSIFESDNRMRARNAEDKAVSEYYLKEAQRHNKNASAQYEMFNEHMHKSSFGSRGSSSTRTKVLAAGAAVAGGYAAYSAVRSKIAKNRTTLNGHKKAIKKYKQQYEKMVNQFKDTPYSELLKKQKKKVG